MNYWRITKKLKPVLAEKCEVKTGILKNVPPTEAKINKEVAFLFQKIGLN